MKFSYGKDPYTKQQERENFAAYMTDWHRIFLVFPRTVGYKDGKKVCLWLCWAERKYFRIIGTWPKYEDEFYSPQYREVN